jgi:phosphomannomutase
MKAIFDKIRQVYPQRISGVNVVGVRDLTVGYDSSTADKKPRLPISSSTQMITFELENGCVMTLRTSGTEPKIKYYTEMKVLKGDGGLQGLVDQMIQELLEPKVNGLK